MQVHTIELDPGAQEITRQNPWSQALFDRPAITQHLGDCDELVETLPEGMFDRIIHDPPLINLAGDLYGAKFYRKLHRLLRAKGRLFHYIGNPENRSMMNVTHGVSDRLRLAGFIHCPGKSTTLLRNSKAGEETLRK